MHFDPSGGLVKTPCTNRWILILLFALFASPLYGEGYQYYPGTALGLGKGFRKLTPTQNFPSCLVLSQTNITTDNTVGAFIFHMDLVDDRKTLYDTLHLDAHLAAHAVAGSANLDAAFDKETSLSSEDLTWVLFGYQEYGGDELSPELNTNASVYKKDVNKLIARCGDEYVQTVQKAAEIAMVFTLHNVSQTEKRTLTMHFDGGASWGSGSVEFSANSRQFLLSAMKHGEIHMRAYGFGGGGISKLGPELVLNPDNFDAVKTTIAKYIQENMIPTKAAPVRYITAYFGSLADPPLVINPVPTPPALISNYLTYRDLQSHVNQIEDILRGRNGEFAYLTEDQVSGYTQLRGNLVKQITDLYKLLGECSKQTEKCKFAEINTEEINFPTNPEERCTKWRRGVCYRCEFPVSFFSANSPSTFTFVCTHLPPKSTVSMGFDGYITITHGFTENNVWNAWLSAYLDGIDEVCPRGAAQRFQYDCTDARVSNGLGSTDPKAVSMNFYWKFFQLRGTHARTDGMTSATGSLVLAHCQTGRYSATCDSVPPGTGTDVAGIDNRGFPPAPPPASVPATFFIEIPPMIVAPETIQTFEGVVKKDCAALASQNLPCPFIVPQR
jgi:hypothetical protein